MFSLKGKYIPDSVIDVMNIILKAPAYFFKRAGAYTFLGFCLAADSGKVFIML